MIRVSGDFGGGFGNALIPSTEGALTPENYRGRKRPVRAAGRPARADERVGARLYSGRIESGVVTHATWRVIQNLPAGLREHYENLNADSLVCYPRTLAARTAAEYDALAQQLGDDALPWEQTLDEASLVLLTRERLDASYVTLRFPLAEVARRLGDCRRAAQEQAGKGSGPDQAWKLQANALYGALASPYLRVNNFVAANLVTAFARAAAFVMGMALNGIQVITDGCSFRVDQMPAGTLAECLQVRPDYLFHRADGGDGVVFQSPADIPTDRVAFTDWYRGHVRRFLGVEKGELDDILGAHQLSLKAAQDGAVTFDALACDGAGNYLKAKVTPDGQFEVLEHKARGYGPEAKRALSGWVLTTYRGDHLTEPPPLVEDRELLSLPRAVQTARSTLSAKAKAVCLPLGLERVRVLNYQALRLSAFVFRTPRQFAAVQRQVRRFVDQYGLGLEVLVLRRDYGGRRGGSIADLAERIALEVRSGKSNVAKTLNLSRPPMALQLKSQDRLKELRRRKAEAAGALRAEMEVTADLAALATGLVLTPRDDLRSGPDQCVLALSVYPIGEGPSSIRPDAVPIWKRAGIEPHSGNSTQAASAGT
jgi:hypothetical protein